MMRRITGRLRMFGGLGAGLVVAVAGTFGVAVGLYSVPRPQDPAIDAYVYARANQQAYLVWSERTDTTFSRLRIEVTRNGSADAGAYVSDSSQQVVSNRDLGVGFSAEWETCSEDAGCDQRRFESAFPPGAFHFSPLFRNARFEGDVDGCHFSLTWTGRGLVAPFTGGDENHSFAGGLDARNQGFGELSRVAPATIESCLVDAVDVPGYLSQGVRRHIEKATVRP